MANNNEKTIDEATLKMLEKADREKIKTAFLRADELKPCPIGSEGSCCKLCAMGPCRLPKPKKPGEDEKFGICGATRETIVARNFIRMIASGVAAHSDHGRAVAQVFYHAMHGNIPDYSIKDEQKLYQLAMDFGIEIGDRPLQDIAKDVAKVALAEFGKQNGELVMARRAPLKRQELWRKQGIFPRGIDREIVEVMHRTHMGVDIDYKNLLRQGSRCALADGWGGSMLATELQDILFGTPQPLYGQVNLGVLDKEQVNIIVHGHEPLLSEMIVVAAQDEEMLKLVKEKGIKGINIAGCCCTANEILMRHGIPLAGNMLQQEIVILTGVVEVMVVDVQCIMQSLPHIAECYHTKIVTTSEKAKMQGAVHIQFDEHDALESAKKIIRLAIDNFNNRKEELIDIPNHKMDLVAGFSHETICYLLGGIFRASYRPLNSNIIDGRIRGVAGVVGCNNPRVKHDNVHVTLVKELIKNDVLVVQTGCAAIACAKAGLMLPEAAHKYAGEGLASVCEAVGIPPVLHVGACVDNSRILMAATAMVREGGLGDDISQLPVAGAAPEWMSEKAIAIGHYFVSSGVYTIFGVSFPTLGSDIVTKYLFEEFVDVTGNTWAYEPDPERMAKLIIDHIDLKRKALGIDKKRERILYDMAMRRELEG